MRDRALRLLIGFLLAVVADRLDSPQDAAAADLPAGTSPRVAPPSPLVVTISVPEIVYMGGPVLAQISVANTGDVGLTDVTVAQTGDGCSTTVEGPHPDTGNGDTTLDGGERWAYSCGLPNVVVPLIAVSATARDPGGVTVRAEDTVRMTLSDPIAISITPSADDFMLGSEVSFVIELQNVGGYPLVSPAAGARLLFPNWRGPIPYLPAAGPSSPPGDGDALFEPGETWPLSISFVVLEPLSYLDVSASVAPENSPKLGLGFFATSAALTGTGPVPGSSVAPPTTRPNLPGTGASRLPASVMALGAGALVVGATLLASSRQRRTRVLPPTRPEHG